MADFEKAWAISASWEGRWVSRPEKGSESEEYIYGAYWGTNHGLTGRYMKEFAGWTANRRGEFQKLNAAQCGAVWKATRWKWMRGDAIAHQDIAAVIFDWFVMRNQRAIQGVVMVLDPSLTAKNWSKSNLVDKYLNKSVGGKPDAPTDGFFGLSALAVERLNGMNQEMLFESIKKNRWAISPTKTDSIKHRYNTFAFGGSQSKNDYCSVTNCNDGRRSLIIQNQPSLDEEKDADGIGVVGALLIAAGVTKLLKWW